MTEPIHGRDVVIAGRPVGWSEALTRVQRYCGLPWDDNPPETWAFRYYDEITTDPTEIVPEDVTCAAALHPGISRDDLAYFWDHREDLTGWLEPFPVDLHLRSADDAVIAQLAELPVRFPGASLTLLSKVLHRKRPWLIPLIDREIIDWYRPLTGQRRAVDAWEPLLHHLAQDLQTNRDPLAEFRLVLCMLHNVTVSDLRTIDIVIWMGAQR